MKRGILVALVSTVLLFAAAPAFAAGGYIGLEGGAVWLSDASTTVGGINQGDAEFDTGWSIGGFGGYDFGTWRLEMELAYRSNDAKDGDGEVSSTALMVNAFYDFKTLSPSAYPYLGAGIGGASVAADATDSISGFRLDDDEIVFAWQLVAGVALPVSKELAIDLNYRYFATSDPSLKTSSGLTVDTEYSSHNVFLGLRFNF